MSRKFGQNIVLLIEIPEREHAEKHRVLRLTLRKLIRARTLYYMKNKRQVTFSRMCAQFISHVGLKDKIEDFFMHLEREKQSFSFEGSAKPNEYNFVCEDIEIHIKKLHNHHSQN